MSTNAIHLNAEERTRILSLLQYFEYLFGGTLGDLETEPVDLELNPDSKPFNCKYYLFPRINKDTFRKELECVVKIGVSTLVQQS